MWLKRLVAISLIITAVGMVGISVVGVLKGDSSIDRLGSNPSGTSGKSGKLVGSSEIAPVASASSSSSSSNIDQGAATNSPTQTDTGQAPTTNPANPTSSSGNGTSSNPSTGSATGGGTTGTPTGGSSGGNTPAPPPAKPVVNITVSPGTITAGSSATIGWSATNSPTSCTAGGSWSGAKGASGSQSTGAIASAGTRTYSLTCVNAGGSATASVNLTVNAAPVVYCGGQTPCYGNGDMSAHASSSNCWAYSKHNRSGAYASVFNLNAASPGSKISTTHGLKGISSGNFYSKCGQDMTSCLNGSGGCTSWKNHSTGNMSSYSQTFIGYFDPAKP